MAGDGAWAGVSGFGLSGKADFVGADGAALPGGGGVGAVAGLGGEIPFDGGVAFCAVSLIPSLSEGLPGSLAKGDGALAAFPASVPGFTSAVFSGVCCRLASAGPFFFEAAFS